MSDFLADCAERIIVLNIVHRRIINRFRKFILWLGIPLHRIQDTKPNEFCRIVSEFALEYRTTRERVIQQLEKKANHRERNKTRGKMITEVRHFCFICIICFSSKNFYWLDLLFLYLWYILYIFDVEYLSFEFNLSSILKWR